jgi:pimeloyl-ACP methyl ester carboxylesterase
MSEPARTTSYVNAPNEVLSASDGIEYAYRDIGAAGEVPLIALHHFRGNLDRWDPALVEALAAGRRVVTFNNRGVASSTGSTPRTFAEMAVDALAFVDALEITEVDLLGFSIGSFIARRSP